MINDDTIHHFQTNTLMTFAKVLLVLLVLLVS